MWSISKLKRNGRLIIFFLLLISMFGPWAYDDIYMPPGTLCAIQVREGFCAEPLTGLWIMRTFFLMVGGSLVDLVRGTAINYDTDHALLIGVGLLTLGLPYISTLLIAIRGDRRPRLAFHLIVCSAAIIAGLTLGLVQKIEPWWLLWGLWLYVAALASAWILEIISLAANRRRPACGA